MLKSQESDRLRLQKIELEKTMPSCVVCNNKFQDKTKCKQCIKPAHDICMSNGVCNMCKPKTF